MKIKNLLKLERNCFSTLGKDFKVYPYRAGDWQELICFVDMYLECKDPIIPLGWDLLPPVKGDFDQRWILTNIPYYLPFSNRRRRGDGENVRRLWFEKYDETLPYEIGEIKKSGPIYIDNYRRGHIESIRIWSNGDVELIRRYNHYGGEWV